MTFDRLLNDCVLVRLEPAPEKTSGGIIRPDADTNPVRMGVVLQTGPGRYWKTRSEKTPEVYQPLDVKIGERVAFFIASVDTKTGKAVTHYLANDERVIRERDILFAIPEGFAVEVTV